MISCIFLECGGLGDGLVIPKMEARPVGSRKPRCRNSGIARSSRTCDSPGAHFSRCLCGIRTRLVSTWAPLEASYVLTVFGIIQGMADAANQDGVPLHDSYS